MILRSLLIVATPYVDVRIESQYTHTHTHTHTHIHTHTHTHILTAQQLSGMHV